MLKVTCKVDTSSTDRWLELVLKDQIQFATALALTKTAQAVKADLTSAMGEVFAKPRAYTLRSLAIRKATKQSLTASVYIRSESVARSLKAEIRGGYRDKAIEKILGSIIPASAYVVPGSEAKLDGEGKISISWLKSLIGKLGYLPTTRRRRRSASAPPVTSCSLHRTVDSMLVSISDKDEGVAAAALRAASQLR